MDETEVSPILILQNRASSSISQYFALKSIGDIVSKYISNLPEAEAHSHVLRIKATWAGFMDVAVSFFL
ncbi:hypothetical protein HK096_002544, partial [Nowakowskiella sp. JEL0078]